MRNVNLSMHERQQTGVLHGNVIFGTLTSTDGLSHLVLVMYIKMFAFIASLKTIRVLL